MPIDPGDKEHKDPEKIDLIVPRRAQHLHNAWKRHQDAVSWVDINLAIRKGLTFYQPRSNAIILLEKSFMKKAYMSPRPPPKISLRHEWTKELGSKVVQQPEGETVRQPEGEVVRQTKFFQSIQLIPNPIRERSGRPDEMQDVISVQACSSEDSKSLNVEQTHDRSGQPTW